jgi:putative YhdH/YhfP family quinone oxidoreductase
MTVNKFTAMIVSENSQGDFERKIDKRELDNLPAGDVLIQVHYSSLNYKDALSAIGNKGVTRRYPHTPGIDAAGIVTQSQNSQFAPGEKVLVTGYDLGMNTSGGFAEYIRVPAEWVVKLPDNLNLKESMIYGTAGFTAGLSVYKLVMAGLDPATGDVLVTGATGGVGTIAIRLLSKAGYRVIAATGKSDSETLLKSLGADEVIDRETVMDTGKRALLPSRWAGVIDTVGGNVLETALKKTHAKGIVTCCGNVANAELKLTVYPFILRGISLLGVDSAQTPMPLRLKIWEKLANEWKSDALESIHHEVDLENLEPQIHKILKGGQTGRCLVSINS